MSRGKHASASLARRTAQADETIKALKTRLAATERENATLQRVAGRTEGLERRCADLTRERDLATSDKVDALMAANDRQAADIELLTRKLGFARKKMLVLVRPFAEDLLVHTERDTNYNQAFYVLAAAFDMRPIDLIAEIRTFGHGKYRTRGSISKGEALGRTINKIERGGKTHMDPLLAKAVLPDEDPEEAP